jgi:hypothetical protein
VVWSARGNVKHLDFVALFRAVAERFDDVDVQIRIPGNEFPEILAAKLQVIALISDTRFSIAASVYSNDVLTPDIRSEDSLRFSEIINYAMGFSLGLDESMQAQIA